MILILQSICNDTPEIPKSEKIECAQHISTSVNNKRGDKRPALFTCTTFIVDLSQKTPTIRCQIPLEFSSLKYYIKAQHEKK